MPNIEMSAQEAEMPPDEERQAIEILDALGDEISAKAVWLAARAFYQPRVSELEAVMEWQPIETAPKDGRAIILLGIPYDAEYPDETIHYPAKAAIGRWNPEGDSWVTTGLRPDKEVYQLQNTGSWSSGGGWFQPDEVSHWMPIPTPPVEALDAREVMERVCICELCKSGMSWTEIVSRDDWTGEFWVHGTRVTKELKNLIAENHRLQTALENLSNSLVDNAEEPPK